jgi:hypothetical protein
MADATSVSNVCALLERGSRKAASFFFFAQHGALTKDIVEELRLTTPYLRRARECILLDLEGTSPLVFSLTLKDGRKIETVGDAASYLSALTEEQRERVHWKTAILMLNNAMKESRYLTTATVNLRSALLYDRLLEQ